MTAHAKLSPSSASGWFTCAAYPDVNAGYADTSSMAAAEGEFAHAVSDWCFDSNLDPYDFVGVIGKYKGFSFEWTEDDADFLQPGIDWVREQPGTFYGEERVDLSDWLGPGMFGTMDRAVVSDSKLVVSDLKFGRGIPVQAVGNKQLRIYALGAWKRHIPHITDKNFPVTIHIDQPRNAAGGGIWTITLGDLLEFGEEARAAAERTRLPTPPRVASRDGCLWCKGKDDCSTYAAFNLELLGIDDFEDLDDVDELSLPDPEGLTPARRRVILDHTPMIKKWLDSVHASVFQAAISGGDTGGLKLVEGRKSADKWKDDKQAEKAIVALLGEKGFTKKLITPTQAGKKISSEDWKPIFNDHVIRGTRKPTLVDVADDRPAIESFTDAGDFEDLDD